MRTSSLLLLTLSLATTLPAQTLHLARTIPLPDVKGRIDHMSIDSNGSRLFVAALGNNTVEVIDLKAGKTLRSLDGFSEPQGVLYLTALNRLYVADGGDGALHVLDGATYAPVTAIKLGDDADNVRYDAAAKQLYVGYGSGALAIVDAEKNSVVSTIPLSGHPESFQIEATGAHIFVNIPSSHTVAVANKSTHQVTGSWSLGLVAANFPMALDETHRRAIIAGRMPARLLVFDTVSGKEVAKLDLHGDCDDVFYDAKRSQLYASCGEGFIDVFTQTDPDHYTLKEAVKTGAKARTCFFDGEQLYLAAPRSKENDARIMVYRFLPGNNAP